jgi:hypothetical protein
MIPEIVLTKTEQQTWHGCYDGGWGNNISPASYAHPAKMARGLAQRIYAYMLERGWLMPGDTVLDPFGGIGGTCLDALTNGLNWVGVELEARFTDLGQGCDCTGISKADWIRFYGRWEKANYKDGRHFCPDCLAQAKQVDESRQLSFFEPEPSAAYIRNSGVIPETLPHRYRGNLDLFKRYARPGTFAVLLNGDSRYLRQVINQAQVDGLLSSPPYADQPTKTSPVKEDSWSDGKARPVGASQRNSNGYGCNPDNLGNLPAGNLDALLTSPPFAGNTGGRGEASRNGIDAALFDRHSGGMKRGTGESPDNLDHLPMKGLAEALLSSPPYANVDPAKSGKGVDLRKNYETYRASGGGSSFEAYCRTQATHSQGYGGSEGQLSGLPSGSFDAALSSPPYAHPAKTGETKEDSWSDGRSRPVGASQRNNGGYGASEGQLGAMKSNDERGMMNDESRGFEGVVTSPPFENQLPSHDNFIPPHDSKFRLKTSYKTGYGSNTGQLGTEQGQTFWSAARLIVAESYHLLKPGSYSAWVCKKFVRNGQIVDFPGQWQQLCEACGFEYVETIRAMLVTERGVQIDLGGEDKRLKTERKSFFRRLHEKRAPHLSIDFEEIVIMRKPL